MKWFNLVPVGLLVLLSSCTTMEIDSMSVVTDGLKRRGPTLHERYDGAQNLLVVLEGEQVVKYRIYRAPAVGQTPYGNHVALDAAYFEALYIYDRATQLCFAGPQRQPVDCNSVRRDPDLGPRM